MAIAFHDDNASASNSLGDTILCATFDEDVSGVSVVCSQPIAWDRTAEETEISCRDGMRIDFIDRLPPGFAMSTDAAVSGQPGPVIPEPSHSAGEMRAKGTIHGCHLIVFKKDCILSICREAFHH